MIFGQPAAIGNVFAVVPVVVILVIAIVVTMIAVAVVMIVAVVVLSKSRDWNREARQKYN